MGTSVPARGRLAGRAGPGLRAEALSIGEDELDESQLSVRAASRRPPSVSCGSAMGFPDAEPEARRSLEPTSTRSATSQRSLASRGETGRRRARSRPELSARTRRGRRWPEPHRRHRGPDGQDSHARTPAPPRCSTPARDLGFARLPLPASARDRAHDVSARPRRLGRARRRSPSGSDLRRSRRLHDLEPAAGGRRARRSRDQVPVRRLRSGGGAAEAGSSRPSATRSWSSARTSRSPSASRPRSPTPTPTTSSCPMSASEWPTALCWRHQGDYFGPTVNLASRLVGVARPGT